jgi:CBS domain-containing protein
LIPVCEGNRLLGMLTGRDIAVRVAAEDRHLKRTTIRDAMTPDVVSCFEDQDVEEAAVLMREQQIRRIPVLSKEKKLVGVVSLGDLAVETSDSELGGNALKVVSQPAGAHCQ